MRIELWFLLIAVLMGVQRWLPFGYVFEWMAVVFVSVLVHELGHAFAFPASAQEPRIALTGMGGLTYGSAPFRSRSEDVTSLAGPSAGFLLLGLPAGSSTVEFGHRSRDSLFWFIRTCLLGQLHLSLVNLVPVLPLDGGHMVQAIRAAFARRVSVVAALAVVVFLLGSGYRYGSCCSCCSAASRPTRSTPSARPCQRRASRAAAVAGRVGGGYGGATTASRPAAPERPKPPKPMSAQGPQRAHFQGCPTCRPS